jgi:23S rRNA (guanosine2251-2'-O)-methyltransferase
VAAGACELIDLVRVTNLVRAIETLQSEGVLVVGTSLSAGASRLQDFDLSAQSALVMGSEGAGLRRLTAERCDGLGYIPLAGSVQSLNVSVATGMGLYELMRQKSAG